jgi:hypothetical protein
MAGSISVVMRSAQGAAGRLHGSSGRGVAACSHSPRWACMTRHTTSSEAAAAALACAALLCPAAVPLARALVHTKVPGWMDEEMPQGGPPANMQRFR